MFIEGAEVGYTVLSSPGCGIKGALVICRSWSCQMRACRSYRPNGNLSRGVLSSTTFVLTSKDELNNSTHMSYSYHCINNTLYKNDSINANAYAKSQRSLEQLSQTPTPPLIGLLITTQHSLSSTRSRPLVLYGPLQQTTTRAWPLSGLRPD